MNLTHNGKIGRMPEAIREEVNVRLRKGERGRAMVAWLNGLPEVQAMVAEEFGGKPVREQNLSEWRKGGHQQWLREREAERLMPQLGAGTVLPADIEPSSVLKNLVTFVTVRYVVGMKRRLDQNSDPATAWQQIRECSRDVLALQRGDQQGRRLELQDRRLEFQQQKVRAKLFMQLSGGRTYGEGLSGEHSTPDIQHPTPKDEDLEESEGLSALIQNKKEEGEFIQSVNDTALPAESVNATKTWESEDGHDEEEDRFIRVNPGESDRGDTKDISEVPQETIEAQESKTVCRVVGRNYPMERRWCRGEAGAIDSGNRFNGGQAFSDTDFAGRNSWSMELELAAGKSPEPVLTCREKTCSVETFSVKRCRPGEQSVSLPRPPHPGPLLVEERESVSMRPVDRNSLYRQPFTVFLQNSRKACPTSEAAFWIESGADLRHDDCSNFRQLKLTPISKNPL